MRGEGPSEGDEASAASVVGLLVEHGGQLPALGAFVMEAPCQRLAGTSEPLKQYTLGKGRVRVSSSVCHFASGDLRVSDGQTEGLGFAGRELAYLAIGGSTSQHEPRSVQRAAPTRFKFFCAAL